MIIYDFVIHGFIYNLWAELPLLPPPHPLFSYITSASAWIWLLLCKGKFPAFFAGSGKFYWLSKFSTDKWLIV